MTLPSSSNIFSLFNILCYQPQLRDFFISVCGTDQCGKKEEVSPLHKQQSGSKNQDQDRKFRTKNIFMEITKHRQYLTSFLPIILFTGICWGFPSMLPWFLSISLELCLSLFISIEKDKNYVCIILHEFQDGFRF